MLRTRIHMGKALNRFSYEFLINALFLICTQVGHYLCKPNGLFIHEAVPTSSCFMLDCINVNEVSRMHFSCDNMWLLISRQTSIHIRSSRNVLGQGNWGIYFEC